MRSRSTGAASAHSSRPRASGAVATWNGASGQCVLAGLARERRDPIRFPGSSAVRRERLLEAERRRRDVREDEAHENRGALVRLLIVEFAAAVPEAPDHGGPHLSVLAVGPVDAPLTRLGVVHAETQALE